MLKTYETGDNKSYTSAPRSMSSSKRWDTFELPGDISVHKLPTKRDYSSQFYLYCRSQMLIDEVDDSEWGALPQMLDVVS